jgi:hypothetical protein
LVRLLYPGPFSEDIPEVARNFYRQFYQVDLSAAELARLLDSTSPKR